MARKKKNAGKSLKAFVLVFVLIFAVLLAGMAALRLLDNDKQSGGEMIAVEIPVGSTTKNIAGILKENGLIKSEKKFILESKLANNDGKYKAGTYSLSSSMSIEEIMDIIVQGKNIKKRFTVPEGFDINRTCKRLESEGLLTEKEFKDEIENGKFDYKFLKDVKPGENRLEGFLFPETYEVYAGMSARELINMMLVQFDKNFPSEYYERANELNMTVSEVITLASIIEREAVVEKDRPIISGVFHNRLKKGMKLQSCATVQYILGEQKKRLTNEDISIDSPYNTYKIIGLPPGPICSPGALSIKAALYPKESDYLFFVAKGDGSHAFSKTYEEHLKEKEKYIG